VTDEVTAEAELIRSASEGNLGSFAQLVALYRPRVIRTAYGIVGSPDEAEDVAQEVFIKVWSNLAHYNAQGAFASWLYRITTNAAIDSLRKRRREVPLEPYHSVDKEPPEATVVANDSRERLKKAVNALPPNARATLILREFEQLSYKEIAEALQIPIGTVMSRLNYARQLLRKELTEGNGA